MGRWQQSLVLPRSWGRASSPARWIGNSSPMGPSRASRTHSPCSDAGGGPAPARKGGEPTAGRRARTAACPGPDCPPGPGRAGPGRAEGSASVACQPSGCGGRPRACRFGGPARSRLGRAACRESVEVVSSLDVTKVLPVPSPGSARSIPVCHCKGGGAVRDDNICGVRGEGFLDGNP
jgi:hypothetical protein